MTKIHYWTLEEIERHIEVAFCEECKTPNCCEFCPLSHLMNDLKHIENKNSGRSRSNE